MPEWDGLRPDVLRLPHGNDAGSGSSSSPRQTLQQAVETIAAGDLILVRWRTSAGCRIRNSGTPAAPKTLARDVGAAVVIRA